MEALRDVLRGRVHEIVNEKIIEPAIDEAQRFLAEKYASLPKTAAGLPILDAGARLTPVELETIRNHQALNEIVSTVADITNDAAGSVQASPAQFGDFPLLDIGTKMKRVGILLSRDAFGLHLTNPANRLQATIFINPLNFAPEASPAHLASLIWHTIKHELVHEKVSGHHEGFTTGEVKLAHGLGARFEVQALQKLEKAYADPADSTRIRKDLSDALQIYSESRFRSEVERDVLGGEGSRTGSPPAGTEVRGGAAPGLPTGRVETIRTGQPPAGGTKLGPGEGGTGGLASRKKLRRTSRMEPPPFRQQPLATAEPPMAAAAA